MYWLLSLASLGALEADLYRSCSWARPLRVFSDASVEVQVPSSPSDEVRAAAEAYRDATAGTDLRGRLFDG